MRSTRGSAAEPVAPPVEPTAPPPVTQTIVIANTPLHGSSLPWDRVPANVQTATGTDVARNREPGLSDLLNTTMGSVHVNEAQGNPLQPDLQFRGFTASPLLGIQQGLSVYVNGMRVNEPFGDTVNWDLFPSSAIGTINLIPGSNPVFGLNTLGGALSVETKTGFSSPGLTAQLSLGSFSRRRAVFSLGGNSGQFGYFVAGSLFGEDGWRAHSPSSLKNAFVDLMYAGGRSSANLSLMAADSSLNGNGPVPVQLLAESRSDAFTYPDSTRNRLFAAILRSERSLSETIRLSALAFFRQGRTLTRNGDQAEFEQCQDPAGANVVCRENDAGELAPVRDGAGNAIPFDDVQPYDAAENGTDTRQRSAGASIQLAVDRALAGRENHLVVGVSVHQANINFTSQSLLARLSSDRGTLPTAIVDDESRVAVDSTVRNLGVYLTDTFQVTSHLFLTVAGRFNLSTLKLADQIDDDLDGDHRFQRLNPSVGVAYQPWSVFGGFISYSQSARTPTALELSCASPDAPCRLPNAFLADPPLAQVVASTTELGLRGRLDLPRTHLEYNAGLFQTNSAHDIIFISDGPLTNQGYFANVGDTRRQGIELGLLGRHRLYSRNVRFEWALHYTLLDATFRTAFQSGSPNHPDARMGEIPVSPGNRLPSMPRHIGKGSLAATIADRARLSVDVLAISSSFYRGDEANLLDQVPGYVVAAVGASYEIRPFVSVFAKASNITGAKFSTFGVLGSPGEVLGPGYDNPRFQTPGAPRAFWVGADFRY